MLGDLRYVSARGVQVFAEPRLDGEAGALYARGRRCAPKNAKAAGQPFDEAAFRAKFLRAGAARLRRAARRPSRRRAATASGCASARRSRRSTASSSSTGAHPRGGGARLRGDQRQVRRELNEDLAQTRKDAALDPRRRRDGPAVVPRARAGRRVDLAAAGRPGAGPDRRAGDRGRATRSRATAGSRPASGDAWWGSTSG